MGDLADPQSQRGLDARPTGPILGGAAEVRQATCPDATDTERDLEPSAQLPTARGPQTFIRRASDSMFFPRVRSATTCSGPPSESVQAGQSPTESRQEIP
jgi:hypothetical protein